MGRAVTTSASREKETRILTVIVSDVAESDLPDTIKRVYVEDGRVGGGGLGESTNASCLPFGSCPALRLTWSLIQSRL